ncbi:MAG: hypothetical protein U9P90_01840 [Patescibacteria group bacterium]|nr:hypothetical protein [Patescibacteria group bacterium]
MNVFKIIGSFLTFLFWLFCLCFAGFEANRMVTYENYVSEEYLTVALGVLIYICIIDVILIVIILIISWFSDLYKEYKRKK